MAAPRNLKDFDWVLVGLALVISAVGILQIYSATLGTVWQDAWLRQALFVVAGVMTLFIVARWDYHALLERAPWLYVGAVVMLVAVLVVGRTVFGSRRWIPLPGGFTLQVSEFAKLVVVLLVARYLHELPGDRLEGKDLLRLGALVGIPMALVAQQPDLGTALTYGAIGAAGVFVAGLRWRHVVVLAVLATLALPASWHLLRDYQKARLISFLDPGRDPLGSGYQVIQSKIAVGSGGVWGKGVTRGSQAQLRFLPVPHTDFIFAAFAEEHGFVGVIAMLGLYFLLLMQIIQNAQMAADRAGMYLCVGVFALLLFHILVNVGMLVGRMPVTGIPLPLMSYGGSGVLTTFAMLGLVNSVRLRRFVN
ncbi:MAG: rod shape-determining protein RodA [Bryobacterales bacterium]|nr:rod shape-determining protein RodA [Bryobacteraceae bacterium]MDW8353374.1 rod shape-determining protein RodA [Bryobacterales bacterium]